VIVLSVASGTSADGLDVGLVDLEPAGVTVRLRVLDTWTDPWPDRLRERLLAMLPPAATTAEELCVVDTEIGRAVAAVASAALTHADGVELVVSPGQTLFHHVVGADCLGTLQVGQPAWVAEATGLPVVSDLRARDVAAGGHGAPLAVVLDALWLAGGHGPRAALNLGGIANVTVVAPDGSALAWDTGPANCLLDVAASWASVGRLTCDEGGELAASGTVVPDLLAALLEHPHLALAPPLSTGREAFSADYLRNVLARFPGLAWSDVLATLTELTAVTVGRALAGRGVTEVVASGGGVRNPVLMASLARHLGVPVRASDDLGLPADGKEAVLWALLGWMTWHGIPVSTDAAGGRPPRLLGRISPGAGPLRLPEPVATPARLEMR